MLSTPIRWTLPGLIPSRVEGPARRPMTASDRAASALPIRLRTAVSRAVAWRERRRARAFRATRAFARRACGLRCASGSQTAPSCAATSGRACARRRGYLAARGPARRTPAPTQRRMLRMLRATLRSRSMSRATSPPTRPAPPCVAGDASTRRAILRTAARAASGAPRAPTRLARAPRARARSRVARASPTATGAPPTAAKRTSRRPCSAARARRCAARASRVPVARARAACRTWATATALRPTAARQTFATTPSTAARAAARAPAVASGAPAARSPSSSSPQRHRATTRAPP